MWTHRSRILLACALGSTLAAACAAPQPRVVQATGARAETITIPAGTHATFFVDKRGQIIDVLDETLIRKADKKDLKNLEVKFSDEPGFDHFETIVIFFRKNPHKLCTAV